MTNVKVFVEGASRGKGKNPSNIIACRRAFSKLAEKLRIQRKPEFIACGGRGETWKTAWERYSKRNVGECVFLLVDSEGLLAASNEAPNMAWNHLRERPFDRWVELGEVNADHVFLVLTAMESWLIADVASLNVALGRGFNAGVMPVWPKLEKVEKAAALEALEKSIALCSSPYKKGQRSFEVLERADPHIIASRCPHAKFFFERLVAECARS